MADITVASNDNCGEYYSPNCHSTLFWENLFCVLSFVLLAGLMAGLTMGLLSQDKLNLTILRMEGSVTEKHHASRILKVLHNRHFLMVSLLLANATANEALPVFLNKLVPESTAILISVTCVLLFGEIIPSAIFSGPNQLVIGSAFVPFVQLLMAVTSPISYPLGRILDWTLGEDSHDLTKYKRRELKALISLQREKKIRLRRQLSVVTSDSVSHKNVNHTRSQVLEASPVVYNTYSPSGTKLHMDEVTIIHGALDLAGKTLQQIMTPFSSIYMLEATQRLDAALMADIMASGHSRIPVFRGIRQNIVGMIIVKRLIVIDPEDARLISDFIFRKPIIVSPDMSCYSMLNEFQKGRSHLALLTRQPKLVWEAWKTHVDVDPTLVTFQGLVTLEDVVEELIQEEIEDETDDSERVHSPAQVAKARQAGMIRAVAKFTQILHRIRTQKSEALSSSATPPVILNIRAAPDERSSLLSKE